eukprot:1060486_1
MESIDDTKKKIASEGTKCAKLMTSIYDDIISKVVARRESLLVEFKRISDAKLADLDRAYEQMKSNSVIASSHISSCYVAVNKQVNLNTIDQRKDNILNVAQTVIKMDIVDAKNPLIKNYKIDFSCDTEKIIKWINNAGLFATIPVPILVSLKPTDAHDGANIKWKLDNVEDEMRNRVNKIKVEWSVTEIKDDDNYDDIKVDWTHHQVIDVNNVNNDSNEMKVDLKNKEGSYVFRMQCMIDDTGSEYSNIKSLRLVGIVQAIFAFTTTGPTAATISENGTRVVSKNGGCCWGCVTSSTGWNSGKYSWKVKCNSRMGDNHDAVGVCTNYAAAKQDVCVQNALGKSIYYYFNRIMKNGANVKMVTQWKAGDIITIILNCDLWKITFLLNDNDLGTYDLDPNEKYYPTLGMCGCPG